MFMIKIDNLYKEYRAENSSILALSGVSLQIAPGKFIVIVGASGCGKTTLLKILAGIEKYDQGNVTVGGEIVQGPSIKRGIVFQEPRLFTWLTVNQNISFGIKGHLSKKEIKNRVDICLNMVGLQAFANAYPYQLSGGMAHRVSIARALATDPDVLLLDEPFAALDAITRARLQADLLELWKTTDKTMVMVTHDIEEALLLGQDVYVMSPGPGRMKASLNITIPYSRERNTDEFIYLKNQIIEML